MALDKMVTTPMARQYLLFTNLGPPNVIETYLRGAFASHNLFTNPKGVLGFNGSVSPVQMYQRAFGDVSTADWTIMNAGDQIRQTISLQEMGGVTDKSYLRKYQGLDKFFSVVPGLMKPAPSQASPSLSSASKSLACSGQC